ncbi:hypothetical protein BHM03_00016236 [Ensete ventricosum]|nr:hypothetical protein BHM03_00016236 [Ensete ventricosum]
MHALRSRPIGALPPWLLLQVQGHLQMVHCPHPPLVQSQGAGPSCNDVLALQFITVPTQSFFLNMRKGNRRYKSVWLPRLYFSLNLRL